MRQKENRLPGIARVWAEAAAGEESSRNWAAAFVMLAGVAVMLAGLTVGWWLRENSLLTVCVCLGGILAGAALIGFSRIVAAAEIYIRRSR